MFRVWGGLARLATTVRCSFPSYTTRTSVRGPTQPVVSLWSRFQRNESGAGGGDQERQRMQDEVVRNIKRMVDDQESQMMKEFSSSEKPEEAWMMHFYKHQNMDYMLPAIRRMTETDAIRTSGPVLSVVIFFLARIFEASPSTLLSQTPMKLPLVSRLDALDMLSILHQVNSQDATPVFRRYAEYVDRSGHTDAKRTLEIIKEVPVKSLKDWPAMHLAYWAQAEARKNNMNVSEMPSLGYSPVHCLDDPDLFWTDDSTTIFDYSHLTQHYRFDHKREYEQQRRKDIDTLRKDSHTLPMGGNGPLVLPKQGGMLPASHDYSVTISASYLESLWASYYATGDDGFLKRVLEMALPWANWADYEGSAGFVVDLNAPFPDSIRRSIEESADPLLSNLNANISRLCCWSLIQNGKAHEAVFRLVAEECAKLGDMYVDPIYANKTYHDSHLKHGKMALYPALLRLMSRVASKRDIADTKTSSN